ncbi:Satratoxin biosynthesis SC3 cluster transcription factor SAT20 like protein [Verticillium longisporum]|nr:Satratoxin biosynthesis SC3 cluster transcription factor SAT20 like protein [Verticillium longisporum]
MYIKNCIRNSFVLVLDRVLGAERNLLWGTYYLAWKLSDSQHLDKDETGLLNKVLELWMAVRLTTTSTVIVGNDTLGMPAKILNETSPQHGKIPLPPVMGAQIDLVLITHIQAKLRREMLDMLQKMTQANKQKTWLTTYLVTFILLHNTAMITEHDARYARKHGMKRRYAREEEVKQYQQGATILLAYFHYCNKGIFPFSDEYAGPRLIRDSGRSCSGRKLLKIATSGSANCTSTTGSRVWNYNGVARTTRDSWVAKSATWLSFVPFDAIDVSSGRNAQAFAAHIVEGLGSPGVDSRRIWDKIVG